MGFESVTSSDFLMKRAVVGSQLFLKLLPGVHFGQGLHTGKRTGHEELGGDQLLGSRFDDVIQVEVGCYFVDSG
jgi:hypothetical protein